MKMETEIAVLTLNCWGIKGVSSDRVERMTAIADQLSSGKYDFVFLQEVWTTEDYDRIKKKTQAVLPHSHYFFSGVIGAGICIFSKTPFTSVFFHQWAVNGYVHKVYHGDWFGGKGIGLAQTVYRGLKINLYTTHLHAEYDRVNDEYMAHRVTQAFDTAQFIALTSQDVDLAIVAGDFNTEPGDLAYRVLLRTAYLRDAFCEYTGALPGPDGTNTSGCTNDRPDNSYTSASRLRTCPHGKRIDYVMFRSGRFVSTKTLSCDMPWPNRVPGKSFSYSDHEAVFTQFKIIKSQTENLDGHVRNAGCPYSKAALEESVEICNHALAHLQTAKSFYYGLGLVLMLVLLVVSSFEFSGVLLYAKAAAQVLLILMFAFSVFMSVFWNRMEVHGILAGKLGMEVELATNARDGTTAENCGDGWAEAPPTIIEKSRL